MVGCTSLLYLPRCGCRILVECLARQQTTIRSGTARDLRLATAPQPAGVVSTQLHIASWSSECRCER